MDFEILACRVQSLEALLLEVASQNCELKKTIGLSGQREEDVVEMIRGLRQEEVKYSYSKHSNGKARWGAAKSDTTALNPERTVKDSREQTERPPLQDDRLSGRERESISVSGLVKGNVAEPHGPQHQLFARSIIPDPLGIIRQPSSPHGFELSNFANLSSPSNILQPHSIPQALQSFAESSNSLRSFTSAATHSSGTVAWLSEVANAADGKSGVSGGGNGAGVVGDAILGGMSEPMSRAPSRGELNAAIALEVGAVCPLSWLHSETRCCRRSRRADSVISLGYA